MCRRNTIIDDYFEILLSRKLGNFGRNKNIYNNSDAIAYKIHELTNEESRRFDARRYTLLAKSRERLIYRLINPETIARHLIRHARHSFAREIFLSANKRRENHATIASHIRIDTNAQRNCAERPLLTLHASRPRVPSFFQGKAR